ncbi:MAG: hypothetical protein H0T53_06140 [Herpetosiphonaceae bacterium]|nr:hypothetical protein [Herpetosiphonaceae bacterium]
MQTSWVRRWLSVMAFAILLTGLVGCGGVKDTAIPAPAGATEVKKGDDATTDLLIDAMTPALEQAATAEKGKVDKQVYYNTSSSVADVAKFYEDEMVKRGWKKIESSEISAENAFLGYESGNNGAFIFAFDNASFGGTGTLVLAANVSK